MKINVHIYTKPSKGKKKNLEKKFFPIISKLLKENGHICLIDVFIAKCPLSGGYNGKYGKADVPIVRGYPASVYLQTNVDQSWKLARDILVGEASFISSQ